MTPQNYYFSFNGNKFYECRGNHIVDALSILYHWHKTKFRVNKYITIRHEDGHVEKKEVTKELLKTLKAYN